MDAAPQTLRVRYLDMARAAALFLVIWGHALSGAGAVSQALYAFHVPLLFFLSGAVFRGGGGYGRFLGKKCRTILVPYLAFGVLSVLLYAALGRLAAGALAVPDANGEYGLGRNLLGLLYGNSKTGLMKWNLPLWFLPCLFVMENLFYPLDRLAGPGKRRPAVLLAALALTLILGRWAAGAPGWTDLPFGLETAVNLFPFFLLGNLLRAPLLRLAGAAEAPGRRAAALTAGAALLALGILGGLRNERVIYTADVYGNVWLFYACAVCGLLGAVLLCAGAGTCRPAEYAGRHTMTALCLHKFPVLFCQVVLPRTAAAMAAGSVPVTLLVAAAAYALCLAADWVIRRRLPFLLGGK